MTAGIIFLIVTILIYIFGHIIAAIGLSQLKWDKLNSIYNPFVIYRENNKRSILEAILTMILGHLLLPLFAPFYWIQKIISIFKKDNKEKEI